MLYRICSCKIIKNVEMSKRCNIVYDIVLPTIQMKNCSLWCISAFSSFVSFKIMQLHCSVARDQTTELDDLRGIRASLARSPSCCLCNFRIVRRSPIMMLTFGITGMPVSSLADWISESLSNHKASDDQACPHLDC